MSSVYNVAAGVGASAGVCLFVCLSVAHRQLHTHTHTHTPICRQLAPICGDAVENSLLSVVQLLSVF